MFLETRSLRLDITADNTALKLAARPGNALRPALMSMPAGRGPDAGNPDQTAGFPCAGYLVPPPRAAHPELTQEEVTAPVPDFIVIPSTRISSSAILDLWRRGEC